MKSLPWHNFVQAQIAKSVELRSQMLDGAFECMAEGDVEAGLIMLHDVVKAEMGFAELARRTGLNEKSLHRALSPKGNPTVRTVIRVRKALVENMG